MAKRKAPARRSKAYEAGMKMRRRWMGKDYVERAFRDADDFTVDLTKAEIKELLLHGAVYCGAPAALDGFRVAKRILAEHARAA